MADRNWKGLYFDHVQLGTDEMLDITRDFTSETLDADGTQVRNVTSVEVTSDPSDLTITEQAIQADSQHVLCKLSAPTAGQAYSVWHKATIAKIADPTDTIVRKPLPILVTGVDKDAVSTAELQLAIDTYISFPAVSVATGTNWDLEYTVIPSEVQNAIARYVWNSSDSYGRSNDASQWRFRRSQNREINFQALANTSYTVKETYDATAMTNTVLINGFRFAISYTIAMGTLANFTIGGGSGSSTMPSTIKDVRLWIAGTLAHHWPIDDNVDDGGVITDLIGGANGTLTLGSGAWS